MDHPTSGKGAVVLGVIVALLLVLLVTSGFAPFILATVILIPVAYGLYYAGYRLDRWFKGKRGRSR